MKPGGADLSGDSGGSEEMSRKRCPFPILNYAAYLILAISALVLLYLFITSNPKSQSAPSPELAQAKSVLLAFGSTLLTLSLDTGEIKRDELRSDILAYEAQPLGKRFYLLSFVDNELVPGFLVLGKDGEVLVAVEGMTAWQMSEDVVMGVLAEAPLEFRATENAVALWELPSGKQLSYLPNTVPLTGLNLTIGGQGAISSSITRDSVLLFTYTRSTSSLYEALGQSSTFHLLSRRTGKFRWQRNVQLLTEVAEVELLYSNEKYLLVGAPVDYETYLYIALDAQGGTPLWQDRRNEFPSTKTYYPYVNIYSILPIQRNEYSVAFPFFNALTGEKGFLRVNFVSGSFTYENYPPQMSKLEEKYMKLFSPSEKPTKLTHNLFPGFSLTISEFEDIVGKGEDFTWEIPFTPYFSGNLKPLYWGDRYLVLLETSDVESHVASQGVPHVLSISTGEKHPELEKLASLKLITPIHTAGGEVILTKKSLTFLSEGGIKSKSLEFTRF